MNGHPLGVDATGAFSGSVDLNGASSITLGLSSPTGGQTVFTIPLNLAGVDGVIPAGVLDSIQQAGVTLLKPVSGDNGSLLTVGGAVLDKGQLAGLTANGKDILGALGKDGSFIVQLPGTTKVVTVTATDTHGTSETIVSGVAQNQLTAGTTVAASAVGIRIFKVRFFKKNALRTHRMRMVVTVKDRRGFLIRGAKITVEVDQDPPTLESSDDASERSQRPGDLHAPAAQGRLRQAPDRRHPCQDAQGEGLEEELGERSALEAHRSEALARRECSSQPSAPCQSEASDRLRVTRTAVMKTSKQSWCATVSGGTASRAEE